MGIHIKVIAVDAQDLTFPLSICFFNNDTSLKISFFIIHSKNRDFLKTPRGTGKIIKNRDCPAKSETSSHLNIDGTVFCLLQIVFYLFLLYPMRSMKKSIGIGLAASSIDWIFDLSVIIGNLCWRHGGIELKSKIAIDSHLLLEE